MSDTHDVDWADDAPTGEIFASVWYCEDDCGCSEASIYHVAERNRDGGIFRSTVLWRGTYHIEYELGATTELNREARRLRKHHNELFHRISWPWDRRARA